MKEIHSFNELIIFCCWHENGGFLRPRHRQTGYNVFGFLADLRAQQGGLILVSCLHNKLLH
jgi:hypothetical protein